MTPTTPPPGDDDPSGDLVRRAQHGDTAALDALFDRCHDRLVRLIRARMSPATRRFEESTDVLQSALHEAVRDLPAFDYRGRGSFHRWLATIVEHKLRHHARDRQRARRDVDRAVSIDGEAAEPVAEDRSPSRAAVLAEVTERTRAALQELADDERDMIVWRQFDHLTNQQVAGLLLVSEAAASKRYLRALQRLQGLLEAHGISASP